MSFMGKTALASVIDMKIINIAALPPPHPWRGDGFVATLAEASLTRPRIDVQERRAPGGSETRNCLKRQLGAVPVGCQNQVRDRQGLSAVWKA
jgi:hypothetical protein